MAGTGATLQDFRAQIGTTFRVEGLEAEVDLELNSVDDLPVSGPGRAEPFSLLFTGAADRFLPQATYRMRHETLGELEVFFVPIGPDPQTGLMRYETIFN